MDMLETFRATGERLNGELSSAFRTDGLGEYLSGAVTFLIGESPYTMFFHKGRVIEVQAGLPLTGLDFGVGGPENGWEELYAHRNFSRSIAPRHGKLSLRGNLVRAMGNLNCLGFIARTLCLVLAGSGERRRPPSL